MDYKLKYEEYFGGAVIFSKEQDFANVMEALQASSSTVKSFEDMDDLIKSSEKLCLRWISWLIERGTSNGKRRQGFGTMAGGSQ